VLADAGLVASNVGEITAQAASEYMTASLVQWKKDASEAMGKHNCPFAQQCA